MSAARPLIFVVLLVVSVATAWRTRATAMDGYLETREYEDLYYLPPPTWLELLSLGHREAFADLIWMKSLIYVGDEFHEQGGMDNVFRYAEAMITLDPRFRRAYTWAGVTGLYRPVEATTEDFEKTVDYLRRGVRQFPNDADLKWDLGTTMMYELARRYEGQEKEAVEREATGYMVEASRLGAGPDYIALTNASRLLQQGRIDMAIRHLEEMYPLVDDEATRARIVGELQQLRGAAEAEAIQASRAQFQTDWRAHLPWVPAPFFAVVGPPVPEGYLPPEFRMPDIEEPVPAPESPESATPESATPESATP